MKFFFYSSISSLTYPPISSVFTGSLLHYKVCNSLVEKEVIVEADIIPVGWVSLGKFDFPVGQAQVILDDRGGEIKADAEDKSAGLVQVMALPWMINYQLRSN